MSNKLLLAVNFVGTDKLSGAIKNIIGTGNKGARALKGMKDEARKLERELADVRREIKNGAGNMTQLINRERELESATAGANAKLDQQYRNISRIAKADKMQARGKQLVSSGRDDIMRGATLAAPIFLAAKAAGDFSSGMVDVQQKANLSNAATLKLKNNIISGALAAKQLPEDMRAAVDVLAGKGLDPRQAAIMAPAIGRLGTAFKVELADGAAAGFANLKNLKVPLAQAAAGFDIMAAGANEGGFEVQDMARHFPSLTAQMQALGENGTPAVADLTAALQIAMNTAGSADEAGNNIKNLLAKINAPATIRAFEKNFGINLPAAMKKLTDEGMSSMEAIATITKQATGGDMKKLGFGFEDMQARMGILALIQNLDEYRSMREKISNSSGTIDKAFDQRVLNDANVSWRAFMATASVFAITMGTTVLPVMTELLGSLNSGVSAISAWAQANPEAAGAVIKTVGALAALKIGLGAAQIAFGGLLGPAASVFKFFSVTNAVGISRFARVLMLLKGGAMIAGKAILFLGRAILLNPIGLLVTAIAVAAYMIYKHWDKIKSVFMAGVSYITSLGSKMYSIGKNIMQGLASGITSAPGAVWNALKSVVMGGINKVKNLLGIKSPSRLFMALGGYMAQGMELGITGGGKNTIRAAGRLAAGVAGAGALSLSPAAATPIQRAASSASAVPGGNSGGAAPISITIYGSAGQDVNELADLVMAKLKRAQGVQNRSALDDGI